MYKHTEYISPIQGFCQKCGRNYELENINTEDKPIYVMPVHYVIKGNGSKTVIKCKNSGGKAE